MCDILKVVDGLIIARDDLSAYYTEKEIASITNDIIKLCAANEKISIPASNYFNSLCNSVNISTNEYIELLKLHQNNQQYIYCNESNKCPDWRRFHKIELCLEEENKKC